MNIEQYKELKNSDIEALRAVDMQYVSRETLFKKSEFSGLSEEEQASKAYDLGWRWDIRTSRYFRIAGY